MANAKTVTTPETDKLKVEEAAAPKKSPNADLVAKVKESFESAETKAVREAHGMCAAIRAVAVLHPTVPVAEFKAAAMASGFHGATATIQRRAALNAARA